MCLTSNVIISKDILEITNNMFIIEYYYNSIQPLHVNILNAFLCSSEISCSILYKYISYGIIQLIHGHVLCEFILHMLS